MTTTNFDQVSFGFCIMEKTKILFVCFYCLKTIPKVKIRPVGHAV